MRAIDTLLEGLIDYAGLFPPAALSMEEAVRNYASYREAPDSKVLGAFVVPVSRVGELLMAGAAPEAGRPWPVSVLWTRGPDVDGPATSRLRREEPRLEIVSIEARAEEIPALPRFVEAAEGVPLHAEFSWREDVGPWMDEIHRLGLRAKIRTGGVEAEWIPPIERVAGFLEACVRTETVFKATAGLHHPIRAEHPLTYDPGSARSIMHGYLNVFLGALFLWNGDLDSPDFLAILDERDSTAFTVDASHVGWRDRRVGPARIREFRDTLGSSFGSCSFREPLDDLRHLY